MFISQLFVSIFLLNPLTLLRIRAGSVVDLSMWWSCMVNMKGVKKRPLGPIRCNQCIEMHIFILKAQLIYPYILPIVPARCLRFHYKTFFIYTTCMLRAPARCCCPSVRASLLLCFCPRTWPVCPITLQCNAKRTFSSHFTLHTALFTARTSQYTLHTPHFISSRILISSHLMSPHLSSSHVDPSLLTCHLSKFFSTVFISSEHWKKFISTRLISSAHQKDLTVGAKYFCTKEH